MIFGRAYPIKSAVFVGRQRFSAAASSYTLTANAGAYTVAGIVSSKRIGRNSAAGAYAVAGVAATLRSSRTMAAATGVYTVSGQDATLSEANVYTLIAGTGTYVVSGQTSITSSVRKLTAAAGAYVVSGQNANLTEASVHVLTADAGSYTISGQAATFDVTLSLQAGAGSYVVNGQSSNLVYFSASAPVIGGKQPVRRWVPNAEELARDKKNKSNFPYKHQFPDDREKRIHQSATILARSGGHARAKNLTPSERTKIATHAAKTRWK